MQRRFETVPGIVVVNLQEISDPPWNKGNLR